MLIFLFSKHETTHNFKHTKDMVKSSKLYMTLHFPHISYIRNCNNDKLIRLKKLPLITLYLNLIKIYL